MTSGFDIFLVIIGCSIVTMLEKSLPIWILGGRTLPPKVEKWLGYAPAAVLAALLVPEIFLSKGPDQSYSLFISLKNVFLVASVPAFVVAYKKESFFAAILVGMATVAILRNWMF